MPTNTFTQIAKFGNWEDKLLVTETSMVICYIDTPKQPKNLNALFNKLTNSYNKKLFESREHDITKELRERNIDFKNHQRINFWGGDEFIWAQGVSGTNRLLKFLSQDYQSNIRTVNCVVIEDVEEETEEGLKVGSNISKAVDKVLFIVKDADRQLEKKVTVRSKCLIPQRMRESIRFNLGILKILNLKLSYDKFALLRDSMIKQGLMPNYNVISDSMEKRLIDKYRITLISNFFKQCVKDIWKVKYHR